MIQQIFDFFPIKNIANEADNFAKYELKYTASIESDIAKKFNRAAYDIFNSHITCISYEWSFEIEENNYSINENKFEDLDEIEQDEITITLLIFKKGNKIVIFNEEVFFDSIENIGLEGVLKILNSYNTGIQFTNNATQYKLSSYFIGLNLDLKQLPEQQVTLSNQCNFNNYSDFKYSPEAFNLGESSIEDKMINLMAKIYQVFILIYIFDRSEINKDNVVLKISGFKTLEFNLDFKTFDTSSLPIYEKIFQWIYSEKNKVEDKIGIVRNILSIYLKEGSILIDQNTFNSILSANNTYIKGNISKYIETRNKLHEQIEQISTKINLSLEVFYNNFQKSIFVFISFYLSIFVLKVYTKTDPTTAINKEGTIMAMGLLFLSLLFLIFSIYILKLEKSRIAEKYQNVKSRSLDLLVQEDINKILKDDKEYNEELTFLDNRRNLYISLWISTLIVFLSILFTTSEYINFKYLVKEETKQGKTKEIIHVNKKQTQPQ